MFTDVVKVLNRSTKHIRTYRLNAVQPLSDLSTGWVRRNFMHVEFYVSRNFLVLSWILFNFFCLTHRKKLQKRQYIII